MSEIIEISQPAPSSCQERIMNGPIRAVHSDKEYCAEGGAEEDGYEEAAHLLLEISSIEND